MAVPLTGTPNLANLQSLPDGTPVYDGGGNYAGVAQTSSFGGGMALNTGVSASDATAPGGGTTSTTGTGTGATAGTGTTAGTGVGTGGIGVGGTQNNSTSAPSVSGTGVNAPTTPTTTVLAPVTVSAPKVTTPIPNPLNAYASYTYSWSLWWLSVADYNALMAYDNAADAMSYQLTKTGPNASYVVAEDGGLFPNQRLPSTFGLNYNIQDVQFNTTIALTEKTNASNLIDGSITIVEPYGITLLDSLIAASASVLGNNVGFVNYTQHPYMLQLNFKGYDDSGNPIPSAPAVPLDKRFPISILTMKMAFTDKGTEYKLGIAAQGQIGHGDEFKDLPIQVSLAASTVGEFFTELSKSINSFRKAQATPPNNQYQYADGIVFDIDPSIAASSIINKGQTSLLNANPNAGQIDVSKTSFTLPAGSNILDIIDKTLALSQWIPGQTANLSSDPTDASQQKSINMYKVQSQILLGEYNASATPPVNAGVFDFNRNSYPKVIIYKIHQYSTFNASHPILPQFVDSTPYSDKLYNYYYTGQNTDIIDAKINFDLTYHKPYLAAPSQVASTNPSADSRVDETVSNPATSPPAVALTPSVAARVYPNLGLLGVPTSTPTRVRPIVADRSTTMGMGLLNNPQAQQIIDAVKSLYTKAYSDQISVQLTINGDPTLIKQDDWLYHPSPSKSASQYLPNANGGNGYTFAVKNGHLRMDTNQIVVTFLVNSGSDVDLDYPGGNKGYMYNPSTLTNGTTSPVFVGQYHIIKIENKFSQGQFTQVLQLARMPNGDYAKALAQLLQSNRADNIRQPTWATFASSTTAIPGSQSGLTQAQASSAAATSSSNQRSSQ